MVFHFYRLEVNSFAICKRHYNIRVFRSIYSIVLNLTFGGMYEYIDVFVFDLHMKLFVTDNNIFNHNRLTIGTINIHV